MDESVKSPNEEAFLKQINETRATAASPEMPPSFIPATPQTPDSTKSSAKAGDGGTGGGGKGGSGGGSGKGSNSSENDPFFTKEEYKIFMYVGLFLFLCVVFMLTQKFIADYLSVRPTQQPQTQIISNSAPVSSKPSTDATSTIVKDSKSVVYGTSFDCPVGSNQEERNVIFDSKEVQIIESGKSFHAPSGCMIIQVNETVTDLKGNDYLLSVADPSASGKFFRCGTYSGLNNTLKECKSFLNYHSGRKVIVGVNGGSLIIN